MCVNLEKSKVRTGLEVLIKDPPVLIKGKRLGLLCNQASVDSFYCHARDLISNAFPGQLRAIFSPQHGFYAEKQDNMKESPDIHDPVSGLPVFSLYGKSRIPFKEQLDLIDILIVDLQDTGCRVYTYIWTLFLAIKACAEHGVEVLVLDRPNPVGGVEVEGNIVKEDCFSFVGLAPIPMRHGLTIGELAVMFKGFHKGVSLHVIRMSGWKRFMFFDDTGLPWVWPSPNMPSLFTATVYPGQVTLEGVNVSEGRGTTIPFELFGAPWLDVDKVIEAMNSSGLEGFVLRRQDFEPVFNKYGGQRCNGAQIHVTDRRVFAPYLFSLLLLSVIKRVHSDEFSWNPPPYEYEFERTPFDLITGDKNIRNAVESSEDKDFFIQFWKEEQEEFRLESRDYYLYD